MKSGSITFVLPKGYDLGGVTAWTFRTITDLHDRGYHTAIVAHEARDHQLNYVVPAETQILSKPAKPQKIRFETQYLLKYLDIYKKIPEGIVIPNFSAQSYGTFALATLMRSDLRAVGFAHSDDDYYYDILTFYSPIISKFIAVSQDIYQKLCQLLPGREEDISCLPYSVSAKEFFQRKPRRKIKLVYSARICQRQKRVLDLPKLVKHLLASGTEFELHIFGDGSELPELKHRMRKFDCVHFHGAVLPHEMREKFNEFDAIVMVSDYEGTSISVLEAMAAGCVPVVTQTSGVQELVSPKNGICVPVGDMKTMAKQFHVLSQDKERLHAMQLASYERAKSLFSPENYYQNLCSILSKARKSPNRVWPISSRRPVPVSYAGDEEIGSIQTEYQLVSLDYKRIRNKLASLHLVEARMALYKNAKGSFLRHISTSSRLRAFWTLKRLYRIVWFRLQTSYRSKNWHWLFGKWQPLEP